MTLIENAEKVASVSADIIGDICGICGCVLEAKTRVEDEYCELNKW